MRTSLAWIQPHPHGAMLRHILNTVNSFQITLSIDFENILLPNDLIIVRNHGDDEEDFGESFRGMHQFARLLTVLGLSFSVVVLLRWLIIILPRILSLCQHFICQHHLLSTMIGKMLWRIYCGIMVCKRI
jgi:hypothetical protein